MPAPAAVPKMGMKEPMAAPARRAGTESGIGTACSDCSSDKGSGFLRDPVPDHEFACFAAWAGWYEFFHEHLLDGEKNSARLNGLALHVLFVRAFSH